MYKHNYIKRKSIHLFLLVLFTTSNLLAAGISPDNKRVENIIKSMTLREKVGQLFIVDLHRLAKQKDITEISPILKEKLVAYKFGGIALFAENLATEKQIIKLIEDIRATEKIPMFISIDEEGGRVSRLQHTTELGLAQTPTAEIVGKKNDPAYAYTIGNKLAEQLIKFGFNLDFYPVADINTNPLNTIIGKRAFGNNPELVSKMVVATIQGLQDNGIMATAKHFPGHGDTEIDTHKALAIINHDIERLRREEFIPFKAAIDNGVKFIMLAHIATPEITGNNLPATFSNFFTEKILRQELGFTGIIITDAMMMNAITDNYSSAEACVKAIEAGVDILLMPDNIAEGYTAVLKKAETDKSFEAKINNALKHIIKCKLDL